MNSSSSLLTHQILDYLNKYTSFRPINDDLTTLSKEFFQQYSTRKQMLLTKLNESKIKQLDLSTKIDQSKYKVLTYRSQLILLQQSRESIIQQIDNKQNELIQLEKRQSLNRPHSKQQKLLELAEGMEICENTLETVKTEFNDNHKIMDWESSLNQQLKQTHDQLQRQNDQNILKINQLNQSMQNNTKKIIKLLQLISDLRQMIVQSKSSNQTNPLPLQVDDSSNSTFIYIIEIIKSIIEKIENTKLPGKEQQEHEILNSNKLTQSNSLYLSNQIRVTIYTPRFQSSVRFKANDILPQARIRTEADDKLDYGCEKRIATDCGFYEEDEQSSDDDNQVLKVPFQSKKSLNCERTKKKKQSYISVASFSSQASSDQKYINLQDELNYLGEINEYYCTRKFVDDQFIVAPCQTPLEQSIELNSKPPIQEEQPKSTSFIKKILGVGLGIGLSYACYKFFKK
ncbi:unnamed protein product (macronuclear) [Paramecium tetraurelia]|uniref:Uncharacterized protein n=1 Tax=Paramecium tetraurelia TaxID=5888 RepID=A0C389_PARTE|nr:uncharacterized protein GSPATT00034734001 [Paramecium tetraurelia]CAK65256.1 unnamed protein product [Paramecium tetraurelia]|eukprot:XP_001432653.1 hypothetical protein (macronuclear) [Paramecium tetraurelia strain d4-2]